MSQYDVGDTVRLTLTVDPDELPTLAVTAPTGATTAPVVTGSDGSYSALVAATAPGTWHYRWATRNGVENSWFIVAGPDAGMLISLADVKAQLNKSPGVTVDDAELRDYIEAASAVVEHRIGAVADPVPAAVRIATAIIVQHLWRTQNGPGRARGQVDDLAAVPGAGYALPNRALELLAPFEEAHRKRRRVGAPVFSFPAPVPWP